MKFFYDKSDYTHYGSFYYIPVYLNLNEESPVVCGTNIIYDWIFIAVAYIHSTIIEFWAQTFSSYMGLDYESGFSFYIKGKIKKDSNYLEQ